MDRMVARELSRQRVQARVLSETRYDALYAATQSSASGASAVNIPSPADIQGGVLLFLHLHTLAVVDGDTLLGRVLRASSCTIVVDVCLAERNLDILAAWVRFWSTSIAGSSARCAAFLKAGGVEGSVYRCRAQVLERRRCAGGAIALLALRSGLM